MHQDLNEIEVRYLLGVLMEGSDRLNDEREKLRRKSCNKKHLTHNLIQEIIKNSYKLSSVSKMLLSIFNCLNEHELYEEEIAITKENLEDYQEIIDAYEQLVSKAKNERAKQN